MQTDEDDFLSNIQANFLSNFLSSSQFFLTGY